MDMRKILACASVFAPVFLAGAVCAADLPTHKATPPIAPPPAFTWAGGYAGSNIGVGFIDGKADPACINPAGVSLGVGCAVAPQLKLSAAGFLAGAQSGYNWQFNSIVLGFEDDIQGAGLQKSSSTTGTFPQTGGTFTALGTITAKERLNYFGTVRGRLGYAFDRLLIYATGGLIYGDMNLSFSRLFPAVSFVGSDDSLRFGGTIGGGFEYAFNDRWSAKVEGLYYSFGSKTLLSTALPAPNGFQTGFKFREDGELVRVGLNYRFGSLW
jgi:outer membrane immunogenic protein